MEDENPTSWIIPVDPRKKPRRYTELDSELVKRWPHIYFIGEGGPSLEREYLGQQEAFIDGAKWLATKLRSLAFPNNTEDQVIRLSDLKKIVGEE